MSKKNDAAATVGGRLRQERKRIGMTQEELASALGVHRLTQINYELGRTEPDAAYIAALREAGIDGAYVLTGALRAASGDHGRAAERLLLALCEAMQVPFEQAQQALNLASGEASSAEIARHAGLLMRKSPLLASANKALAVDRDLLVDILEGVDIELAKRGKAVTPLRKAHVVARLYSTFSLTGEVDKELLESAVASLPAPLTDS